MIRKDKLRVLLCGTGQNAAWHLAESRRGRAARITHVFGHDQARTEAFAKRHGLGPVSDLGAFLALGRVEGVDVCTVHRRHAPLARAAIEAGLPVLVEKPLACSSAEGEALVEAAEKKGVPLGILYHKRYAPQHAGMRRFIQGGGFGPGPVEVEMSIHHAADSRAFEYGESWKAAVDLNGGGILMNQVVHYLDLLTWWLGRVEKVEADLTLGQSSLEGESTAALKIIFKSGHRARFLATVACRKSLPVSWAVHGTRGSVVFHGMEKIRDTVGLTAHEAFRFRFQDRWLSRIPYRLRARLGRPLTRLDEESAGAGWDEFFSAVARGERPPVEGREGLPVLELVEAAYGGKPPRVEPRPGQIPPSFGRPALDYYLSLGEEERGLDVLLVNPLMESELNRAFAHIHIHRPRPPLGLASATAWLRRDGLKARTIDAASFGFGPGETAAIVRAFAPRHLVLTTAQADRWQNPDLDISAATEVMTKVRETHLGKIILLGPHGSATPAWTLHKTKADAVVRGEPERTLLALIKALDQGASLEEVPGVAWLEGGLTRESGAPAVFDDDLDGYPRPAFEDLPMTRYEYTAEALRGPYSSLLTSRGCPARCVFCLKTMMPGRWRAMSGPRVVEEMAHLRETYGVESIYFQDWEFLHDKARVLEMARLIRERGLELRWGFSSRASNLVDPELLESLARAGCVLINCGYETGAQALLNAAKKGVKLDSARQAVENCRRAGIELRLFGLVNLPGEKLSTIRQSVRFLTRAGTEIVHPNLPIPYPTTKLWEQSGAPLDWEKVGRYEGRVGTRLKPRLALFYFKHLNRNRRFGRGYLFRPRFWRYLRITGYLRAGRFLPGF